MLDFTGLQWKKADEDAGPDNMIPRRAFVKPQGGVIVVPAEFAPAGAPIEPVEYDDGVTKPGLVLGKGGRPVVMRFVTSATDFWDSRRNRNGRTLAPIRYRERTSRSGEVSSRPMMRVPVLFDGCEGLFRLSINGLSVFAWNDYVEAFEKQIVQPAGQADPRAHEHLLCFEFEVRLTRRCKAGETWILAPELSFRPYADCVLPNTEIQAALDLYRAEALPFLEAQEDQRRREREAMRAARVA